MSDHTHKNEINIVRLIHLAVIDSSVFEDKYPALLKVLGKSKHPIEDWSFFMTIAGVGFYILTHTVSKEEHKELRDYLFKLDKRMPDGLDNLAGFLDNPKNKDTGLDYLIGFWVLWNIIGKPPSHEESKELAPAIGKYLEILINQN